MSARLCGVTLPDSRRHGTDCALQRHPEPKLTDCSWRTRHLNLSFITTHLIYDTRPCACSKCMLCTSPSHKARRRLWVCVEEDRKYPILNVLSTLTGSELRTYFKAFLPDPAAIKAVWEEVGRNVRAASGGGDSAASSSQPSAPKKCGSPFPPLPVGCWNPGCTNLSGVSEAALCSKMCGRCRRARYCSLECQKEDWDRHRESTHMGRCKLP
jgi:hypothetical protein